MNIREAFRSEFSFFTGNTRALALAIPIFLVIRTLVQEPVVRQ